VKDYIESRRVRVTLEGLERIFASVHMYHELAEHFESRALLDLTDVLADSLNHEESFRGDVPGAVKGVPAFGEKSRIPQAHLLL